MNHDKQKIGLLKLEKDERDFNSVNFFGLMNVKDLPDEYIAGKPLVKNQGATDLCTAYAVTSASELQEEVELNPQYQFAKIKQIMGDPEPWGADLRSACKSAVKFGSLKETDCPEELKKHRSWVAWPPVKDKEAEKHQKKSYFVVGSMGDVFDSIRVALWQNRAIKGVIITGANWRYEWTSAPNGRIPEKYGDDGFPHAFIIIGWIGEHLIAQLSNSEDVGDKGRFYIKRNIANKELNKYGKFIFIDIDPEEAKKQLWDFWQRLWEKIKKFFI